MSTAQTLEIINASLGIIRLLNAMNVDVSRLAAAQKQASLENRPLSDDELQQFADSAQAAIDGIEVTA